MAKYIVFLIFILIIISLFVIIKRSNEKSEMGQVLYKDSIKNKHKYIRVLFIVIIVTICISQIKDDFSGLGTAIYVLTCMFPIATSVQVFVIKEIGIGKQSILSNGKYGLIEWDKVKGYRWDDDKLTIIYISSNKIESMKFKVNLDHKLRIDDIINRKLEQGES